MGKFSSYTQYLIGRVVIMKYTLITGATGGLGKALAFRLAQKQETLLLVGRNSDKLQTLSEELSGEHHIFCSDLSDAEAVAALKCWTQENLGLPSTVINCAGAGLFGSLESLDDKDIQQSLIDNLLPIIYPCKAFVPDMKQAGGVIVNVMSTAALKGKAGESVYCTAKWGVRGFTESLREEVKGSQLRVVAVYPAGMATGFWENTGVNYPVESFMSAEQAAEMIVAALGQVNKGFVSDITLSR
ncbi:SDR family NAD(P)-dependent oxidoreductase [Parendozoicomonas sp. Alg238-R29]|uniref:SDR family NAD(P)-dependent oxidoreductase n=1 Tax=Parendozoicomonas sp. Alg238-R29 TaxID=2993446 RepID=UPI00248DAF0E|nr:SDR family NAD(P)-dependent oxidoreductase [Parendozoicomonas sp. Alg238-R29]